VTIGADDFSAVDSAATLRHAGNLCYDRIGWVSSLPTATDGFVPGCSSSIGTSFGRNRMCRLFLAIALAFLVLPALDASAQQKTPAPPAQSQPAADNGLTTERLTAIGVGVLAGVVLGEVIGGSEVLKLVGGVAGGYVGAWWYDSNDSRARAGLRQPTAAAWRPERLAFAQ